VAVAASAGGVGAISSFVGALPSDLQAAVLVVLHVPPTAPSVLPSILSRVGPLSALHPVGGEALKAGVIYVAPPDRHMAVTADQVRLLNGPRETGHRPAADVLLRSVAEHFGSQAAGVVLSGTMDDGAAGLRAIGAVGGFTLVQDPAEAAFPGMPLAAIEDAEPAVVGPVSELAARLCSWLSELTELPDVSNLVVAEEDPPDPPGGEDLTQLTCPECGGTLWMHADYGAERLRCRVGHSFSADGLMVGKQNALESALWAAIVALQERADVSRRIVQRLKESGRPAQIERYRSEIRESEQRARVLQDLIGDLVQGVSSIHAEDIHGGTAS
jgi:two-component system, chemotaxis family, protein-glutamate methylesterase/glutaminase